MKIGKYANLETSILCIIAEYMHVHNIATADPIAGQTYHLPKYGWMAKTSDDSLLPTKYE
jgi:hypothetical protein